MSKLLPTSQLRVGTVLISLLAVGIVWAVFGSIDIVVQAQGKLVPSTFVKVSQPSETGPITELLVKDGQAVSKGQVLARVDSSQDVSDLDSERAELARLEVVLKAKEALLLGKPLPSGAGMPAQRSVIEEHVFRRRAYDDAVAQATAAIQKAAYSQSAGEVEMAKQGRTLPVAENSMSRQLSLVDIGLASELQADDKRMELIERQETLRAQRENMGSLKAGVAQAKAALSSVTSDYHRQLSSERTEAFAQIQKLRFSLEKLEHRVGLTELRAPVSGVINSLAVRSPGQVVSAGTVLMTVVPADEPLIAEVWVRNEDAGFVYPSMPVQVKVSTFPFQKYGWLEGELDWIGADSEVPESMKNTQGEPLFFKARVKLSKQALTRNEKDYALKAGMQVVADMQLGQRSLFEYLTSPLKKAVLEAARER